MMEENSSKMDQSIDKSNESLEKAEQRVVKEPERMAKAGPYYTGTKSVNFEQLGRDQWLAQGARVWMCRLVQQLAESGSDSLFSQIRSSSSLQQAAI
jgi:hypothetical protein